MYPGATRGGERGVCAAMRGFMEGWGWGWEGQGEGGVVTLPWRCTALLVPSLPHLPGSSSPLSWPRGTLSGDTPDPNRTRKAIPVWICSDGLPNFQEHLPKTGSINSAPQDTLRDKLSWPSHLDALHTPLSPPPLAPRLRSDPPGASLHR